MRKHPVKHIVHMHRRQGKTIHTYTRGTGHYQFKTPKVSNPSISLTPKHKKIANPALKLSLFSKAKKIFGTTSNHHEAGYILPDGSLLDTMSQSRGSRWSDHEAQAKALGLTIEQLKQSGAVRLVATSRELNLEFHKFINQQQWNKIQEIFKNDEMMEAIRSDRTNDEGKIMASETFLADKIFKTHHINPSAQYQTMEQFKEKYVNA